MARKRPRAEAENRPALGRHNDALFPTAPTAERTIVQEALAQLPWYHHIALLEKLDDLADRLWYAPQARSTVGYADTLGAIKQRRESVQQVAARIPWFHDCLLLDRA